MKHLSSTGDGTAGTGWCSEHPHAARFWILLATLLSVSTLLEAQIHRWSVTGSAGAAILSLGSVDDDNAADAAGWARQGVAVSPFSSVKTGMLYAGQISYRYDRELSLALKLSYSTKNVTSSYRGANAELDLDRGIGSTGADVALAYYPSWRPYFLEWYAQAGFGLTFARATAKARGITYIKIAGVPTPEPLVDTDARFKKTRMSVTAGLGMDIPLVNAFALKAEALYRFAQVGVMEGDVTRFGQTSVEPTTIEFNYSGFLLTAGIKVEL